jgi:hypothetical protein
MTKTRLVSEEKAFNCNTKAESETNIIFFVKVKKNTFSFFVFSFFAMLLLKRSYTFLTRLINNILSWFLETKK